MDISEKKYFLPTRSYILEAEYLPENHEHYDEHVDVLYELLCKNKMFCKESHSSNRQLSTNLVNEARELCIFYNRALSYAKDAINEYDKTKDKDRLKVRLANILVKNPLPTYKYYYNPYLGLKVEAYRGFKLMEILVHKSNELIDNIGGYVNPCKIKLIIPSTDTIFIHHM